jgi:undecaprenyl pyrophosphate synthase
VGPPPSTRHVNQPLIAGAYAELVFLPIMWPEFSAATLVDAIDTYNGKRASFR